MVKTPISYLNILNLDDTLDTCIQCSFICFTKKTNNLLWSVQKISIFAIFKIHFLFIFTLDRDNFKFISHYIKLLYKKGLSRGSLWSFADLEKWYWPWTKLFYTPSYFYTYILLQWQIYSCYTSALVIIMFSKYLTLFSHLHAQRSALIKAQELNKAYNIHK